MDDAQACARAVRAAGNWTALSVSVFFGFTALSTQVGDLRAHSPWAEDPYDLVISYAILLQPLVFALTWARSQRWRAWPTPPRWAQRRILIGAAIATGGDLAVLAAAASALLDGANRDAWNEVTTMLASLAGALAVATAVAIVEQVRAWRSLAALEEEKPARAEPDALDDLIALLTARRLTPPAELAAWLDRSPVSPRRRPWAFCVLAAGGFAAAMASWHVAVEGASVADAAALWPTIAGYAAAGVLIGYALLGRPLRLLRPPRSTFLRSGER